MKFTICGHINVMATHHSTLEFTKDKDLTKRGDCIVGVNADFSYEEILKLREKDEIIIKIMIGGLEDIVKARVNKNFDHKHEIVIRKKDFLSDRTLGIYADKAAIDLDRRIVEKLKDPNAKAMVEII